jgi:hypothetical protein
VARGCDGGEGALGHPRVWLSVDRDTGFVECGYCDKKFVHADFAGAEGRGRPVTGPSGRILAALIALAVFVTLGLRLGVTMRADGSGPFEALWSMYRFFTVITNTPWASWRPWSRWGCGPGAQVQGALLLAIGAVAIVYHLLLAGLVSLTGLEAVIDEMLHTVIPVVYALYWLLFAPKEGLSYGAVPLWLSYPLVYCGYALMRGEIDGIYPYPFLDVAAEGMISVSFNILGLLVAFWIGGLMIVAVGRRLPG